jgi:DNA repair exonuclease SbcCD ATPase subunit
VQTLWAGAEPDTLDDQVRQAIEAVAEARGLDLVDAALGRLGASPRADDFRTPSAARVRDGGSVERPGAGAVRVDPEQVAAEFRSAERELRAHRADVAEVDGDLEVATMDWLRERQDAETTLQAYRDRARELRGRLRRLEAAGPEAPCPTCGRTLQSHYDEVLAELRDEWESVVQDGSWWRSRWEQLEMKPPHLQELEGRSLRLHAALEAGSERVELLRARLGELERTSVREADSDAAGPEGAVVTALRRVRTARLSRASDMVLDRASRFVNRITGGRVVAMSSRDGSVYLEGSEGVVTPLTDEDTAAAKVAVRLAAASLIAAGGRVLASLPIERPFDRLDEEARIRTLVLSRKLLRVVPRIVLITRGEAVDARPELFDYVLEAREEGSLSGPVLRPAAAGPGRVSLKAAMARAARGAVAHPS